jgi:hypothetical protein
MEIFWWNMQGINLGWFYDLLEIFVGKTEKNRDVWLPERDLNPGCR